MNNPTSSQLFNYVVVNGQLLPAAEAQISIFNEALFFSFGVYETIKIDRGRPFYLQEHLRRLLKSAGLIDLTLDVDVSTLAGWFDLLHQVDLQATWNLKIVALGALQTNGEAIIAMQANPLSTYPDTLYKSGAKAVLFEGRRDIPTCKSLNTLVNFLARRRATQAGALEGLLHHNGYVTEGSRSNLFAAQKGMLITPPEAMVLPGITRDIVLQVMCAKKITVVEEPISTDLSKYEEIFISSTSMHVMPVTLIEGQLIGDGRVGPITQMAMQAFNQHYGQVMGRVVQEPL
jgi:branched-subunit amino acid aminotransferase/4-amino-4-deoxychorismate lyase